MLFRKKPIKNYRDIVVFICFYGLMSSPINTCAQGLIINSGHFIFNGPTSLVIADGSFTNNGIFVADSSNIVFTGTADITNSSIGGSSPLDFNNITINKSAYGVKLDSNINLNGNLYMQSDSLYLNGHTISMGSKAMIIGENANSQITGSTGGTVSLSVNLNAPTAVNPGNIGVEITSPHNMGTVTIKRKHIQQTIPNAGKSILRCYDIMPAINSGINATLKFHYTNPELAGNDEFVLTMYISADGGATWTLLGSDASDSINNWVLRNNINHLNLITLASFVNNLAQWVGNTSNSWTDGSNWSTVFVPDVATDVVITANGLFNVIIPNAVTVHCKSIKINPGATVIVATGGNLMIGQ